MKCWNIRDQTTEVLEDLLKRRYEEIEMELLRRRMNNGEDEIINIRDEIESYHEETKITNIIRRATFDIDAANRLIGDNGADGVNMTQMPENLMEAQNIMVTPK
jgi:purine nucleoside phosphorylase